jgi:hypothetical protein
VIEDRLVYDEGPFLRANDDGSKRLTRNTKRNVLATTQVERMVAYDMRGCVRATPGPSGADDLEAALGSPGADDIAAVAMSESGNQRRFRQVKLERYKPVEWRRTRQALPRCEVHLHGEFPRYYWP